MKKEHIIWLPFSLCVIAITISAFSPALNLDNETLGIIGIIGFGSGLASAILILILMQTDKRTSTDTKR